MLKDLNLPNSAEGAMEAGYGGGEWRLRSPGVAVRPWHLSAELTSL